MRVKIEKTINSIKELQAAKNSIDKLKAATTPTVPVTQAKVAGSTAPVAPT